MRRTFLLLFALFLWVPSSLAAAPVSEMVPIAQIGGVSSAVDVQGDIAYLGEGAAMAMVDVSDPAATSLLGRTACPSNVESIDVVGSVAYVVCKEGQLCVFDVSDSAAPQLIGINDELSAATAVEVVGGQAYVTCDTAGLAIVDVSNPNAPTVVGLAAITGKSWRFHLEGERAYVANTGSGLSIVDISDPTKPTWLGSVPWLTGRDVVISGTLAYVDDDNSLVIVDIADPLAPSFVGEFRIDYTPYELCLDGSTLNVGTNRNCGRLFVMDVSDPTEPNVLRCYDTLAEQVDLAMADGLAYLACGEDGLRIINPIDIVNDDPLGGYFAAHVPHEIMVVDDIAYTLDNGRQMAVLDVSNPWQPAGLSAASLDPTPWGVLRYQGMAIAEDMAYVADCKDGLRMFDVSDPRTPQEIGSLSWGRTCFCGVDVENDLACVAAGSEGTWCIDVSDPAQPSLVGVWSAVAEMGAPSPESDAVRIVGDLAFVDEARHGLVILDVSEPAAPTKLSHWTPPTEIVYALDAVGALAYVTYRDEIAIIDATVPTTPVVRSTLALPDTARHIWVHEGLAYVAGEAIDGDNIFVVDVSAPDAPELVSVGSAPGEPASFAMINGYLMVAAKEGGLVPMTEMSRKVSLPMIVR